MTRHVTTVPAAPGWRAFTDHGIGDRTPCVYGVVAWRLITVCETSQTFAIPICIEPVPKVTHIIDPMNNKYEIGCNHFINMELGK